MLDARLKVLAISGYGDIRDAAWAHSLCNSPRFDAARLSRRQMMRKAYLARYLHLPLSTWDDMTHTEIGEWCDATSQIMEAEAKNEGIPI